MERIEAANPSLTVGAPNLDPEFSAMFCKDFTTRPHLQRREVRRHVVAVIALVGHDFLRPWAANPERVEMVRAASKRCYR